MAIHPDSSFPVSASDQADVIRIFLQLMRERHRADHPYEVATNLQLGPGAGVDRPWIPGELLDLD